MMNCFCGMVDRRKTFSLISYRDHCQRSSPSTISDTTRARFEPAQDLSLRFAELDCAVVIVNAPPLISMRGRKRKYKQCKINAYAFA